MTVTLSLVTCGPQLEVALTGGPVRGVSLARLSGRSARSTLLMAAVDLLMEDAGLEPTGIDRVVVSRGPGSFTGIRAGLAAAAGLGAALGVETGTYGSLEAQAARVTTSTGEVWAAQPGRRGEVYARLYEVSPERPPAARGEIEIVTVEEAARVGPWVAAATLDLGEATRAFAVLSAAEGMLRLAELGVEAGPLEPVYVEGAPVHQGAS